MTDTPLALDALFARHKPAHVLGGGAEDYCAECMRLYPCDAVTALHALLDAKARAEKAEAALDGTSALAGEALERALVAEARLVEATAQIKRLAAERDDAADEVERLHRRLADTQAILDGAGVEVERLRKAVWASEEIDRRAGMLAGVEAERDASRTAHAALIADLRALCDDSDHGWVHRRAVLALLDRHAPTTGETP